MSEDPNRTLGPYVEGLLMGVIMASGAEQRLAQQGAGWQISLTDAPDGTHAMYFVSPSGLRWRIRAEIEA